MATIDDYGDTAEPLNNPPLGGPSGWAKAVRDAITDNIAAIDDSVTGISTVMTARTPAEVDWKTGSLANNSVLRVGSICVLSMSMNAEIEFSLSGSVRVIADIPFGYRPPANVYTSLHIAAASGSDYSGPVRCYVYPDGSVQIANVPTVTVGINSALVLQLAYQGA